MKYARSSSKGFHDRSENVATQNTYPFDILPLKCGSKRFPPGPLLERKIEHAQLGIEA